MEPVPRSTLEELVRAARAYFASELPDCRPDELGVVYFDGDRRRRLVLPIKNERPHATRPEAATRHSADFRSVHWYGVDYTFTPLQAAVVRAMWEAWQSGTPDVSQETLLEGSGSESKTIRELFRDHPSWNDMIACRGSRGTLRLVEPE